jgi:hypothetical protein
MSSFREILTKKSNICELFLRKLFKQQNIFRNIMVEPCLTDQQPAGQVGLVTGRVISKVHWADNLQPENTVFTVRLALKKVLQF